MKIKRLTSDAIIPTRGSALSAGLDLYANSQYAVLPKQRQLISTGIAVALPPFTYGRIAPRSGLAVKHGIDVLAGVVDEDYRGELMVALINHDDIPFIVERGSRIAQLIIEQIVRPVIEVVEDLDDTDRNDAGFGSTGV